MLDYSGAEERNHRTRIDGTNLDCYRRIERGPQEAYLAVFTGLSNPADLLTNTTGYFQEGQDAGLGVPKGNLQASTLNTSVMAMAEANYGRTSEALRYVNFIATELDTEQPGALPESFVSLDYPYFQPFVSRAMVMQSWSSYGVEWPVIYHS